MPCFQHVCTFKRQYKAPSGNKIRLYLPWMVYCKNREGLKINPSVYTFKNGQTIYAHWRANKYTIVFQANGGSVSAAKKTVTYGNTCGTLPVPKRTKGSFLGWYTAKTGGTKYTSATKYRVAGNITLYAHWKMPKYTVKFAGNGGKASVSSKTVAYGSKSVLFLLRQEVSTVSLAGTQKRVAVQK